MNVVEIRVINVDNPIWMSELERFCLGVIEEIGKEGWSVSVVICDDEFIRDLNETYRGISKPTDVLSFPQEAFIETGDLHAAGDVIVSLETMKKNAKGLGISEEAEMKRLLVHGILHLTGMDHDKNAMEGGMLDLQEQILLKLQENTF